MNLTEAQRELKREVKEELQPQKLDELVRKSESELITIAGTMGNVENVDTLSKKELIIEIMKHGFSCMPTDMCNGYSEESNREKETESSSEGEGEGEGEVNCSDLSNEDCIDNSSCLLLGKDDDSVCIKAESDVAEPFGNLFNMNDFYRDRNTMIFIIIIILLVMYRDEIMKSDFVKSLKKTFK
tara:strand:- start:224 stop:775 length:552 start_codon:yes stop_codon:yes gene_type:complete